MDSKQVDEILRAIVGAYVWVASSDGGVDGDEWTKYQHVIVGSPFATQFNQEDIRRYFKDFVAMYEDDFEQAMELTKKTLSTFREQKNISEEIFRISRAALVGDARLNEREEVTLKAISESLGLANEDTEF